MTNSKQMPKEEGMDHTLTLLREGYMYILNRRHSFHSNVYETRLLGQKAICMGGKEAAEIFYDTDKFKRTGAAPNRLQETLFGKGAVQGLDGKAHKHRKNLFMSVMTPEYLHSLTNIYKRHWETALNEWEEKEQIILYQEIKEILCKTACEWVGVPLEEKDVISFTNDLAEMFESPAEIGPPHWKGRHSRNKIEKQLQKLVDEARKCESELPENTIFYQFSKHRDEEGNLLDPKIVAVELINLLRPIVAIAIYVNFIFLALYHNSEEKEKIQKEDDTYSKMFVQEVRRFYPFFPALVALVKKDFTWNNFDFKEDTLTLLDLYGTNHDPTIWDNPGVFNPERFADWSGSPFDFIPQGGGDHFLGHRCAGEWATMDIMKVSLDYLTNHISYEVPDEQDLSFSMVKIPSIPKSEIILGNIKRKGS